MLARALPLVLAGLLLAGVARASEPSGPPASPSTGSAYPADPFADDYAPPVAAELGTTAGQLRILALGGLRAEDVQLVGQSLVEMMTIAIVGVRFSSALALAGEEEPQVAAWLVGPSVHLRPYRRFDASFFVEAGPARLSHSGDGARWAPMLSAGASIDVSLTSYWFLRLEGHYAWVVYGREGAVRRYRAPGALFGVGVAF